MTFDRVGFLELLQGKDQELRVMLIRQWALKVQTVSWSSRKIENELTGKELVQTFDSQASEQLQCIWQQLLQR